MKKIQITMRQKSILNEICNCENYITVSNISKKLRVSNRTIIRELYDIEKWLNVYGFNLEKKKGIGIRFDKNCKKDILDMLNKQNGIKIYSPEERQSIIISELLRNQEPVKLYCFTSILNVTEGTLSHDLDKVEEWLEKNKLKLIRRQGLGVYIEGTEKLIRKAIINLIYENINENQLLSIINKLISNEENYDKKERTNSRLLYLIDKNTIEKLENLIYGLQQKIGYQLADNAYVGFIVHLALAIDRIRKNERIIMDKQFLEELSRYPEFLLASELAEEVSQTFQIAIPRDEIGYITMHIIGSRNLGGRYTSKTSIANFQLVKLVREMIKIAENETGCFLQHNEKLLAGMVNHLGPAINRLRMGMDIRNPLLDEIKQYYPDLMEIGKKCASVVEKFINIKMPESEIAYIAMHLGAAIVKKDISLKRIYRTAIACATGIGTSVLLATRIEKEYDNIKIVDVISIIRIDESYLKEKGIEFIISTVHIDNISIPVVVINPLLFEEDKQIIDQFILNYKDLSLNNKYIKEQDIDLIEKFKQIKVYVDSIIEILSKFFIKEYLAFDTVEDIIIEVSNILSLDQNMKTDIEKALLERNQKGGTVLAGQKFVLIHSKAKVSHLFFGVIRIKETLSCVNNKGNIEDLNMAVVMLVPEESNKGALEVMSYISKMIIDKPTFIKELRYGSYDKAYFELSRILDDFYKAKIK